jgi:hypothetical protein
MSPAIVVNSSVLPLRLCADLATDPNPSRLPQVQRAAAPLLWHMVGR